MDKEVINYLLAYNDLKIIQRKDMFNFSLDTVLLANFCTITKDVKKIVDFGTNNAAIPLILSRRTNKPIIGVEIQKEAVELAKKNITLNNLDDQIEIVHSDIKEFVNDSIKVGLVVCNPPFFKVDASIFQLISMSVTSLVSFLAAYGFVRIYTEGKKEKVKTDKKIKAKYCVIGLSLIVILQAILSYLFSKIGLDYNVVELVETEGKFSLLTAILYIVTIALVPAIFEELFFRKALIDFSKKYGKVFAIIISAIIFGLAHMNLSQFIFAFLLGIIFGTIYVYSNDIKLTILLHFLNNGYVALFTVLLTNGIIGENFVEKFNLIVFIISVIVLIVATINFIKNNKEGLKKIKFKKENISEYKYIFLDFTLLISLTLVICCFALTEKLLRLM